MSRPEVRSPREVGSHREVGSLREALARAPGPSAARMLHGRGLSLPLHDLLDRTCLSGEVSGRRVLLATRDQFGAALALVALDGAAEAVLVCPPDLDPGHLAPLARRAGIDALCTDLPRAALPGLDALPIVDLFRPPLRAPVPAAREPAREPAFERATQWLLLTSGTTGVPKLVRHSLAGLTGAIRPADPPPVWATFYDIRRYGGLQIFLRGVLGGSLILGEPGESLPDHLARMAEAGATHVSGTPSHWRRVLMSPARGLIRPSVVRLSGEIADQAVLDALGEAYPGAAIGHAYASTEAGVGFEVTDGREGFPASLLDRPDLPGAVAMKVVDGTLRIRSNRTAAAYVGGDHALVEADGFVDTGDVIETRGGRCHFAGRRGGVINVGGLKVHPEEIEAVINRHAGVRMSLVEARRNPITGAIVQARIVLDDPVADGGPERAGAITREVLAACRAALAPHKVPALVRVVSELAVTAAGKLARHPA